MANQAREKRGEDNEFEFDFELPEVDMNFPELDFELPEVDKKYFLQEITE